MNDLGKNLVNKLASSVQSDSNNDLKQKKSQIFFQFIVIKKLREYLVRDLKPRELFVEPKRLCDDFVLFCIFCGNDFLPKLPTLNIHEGAIELLIYVYRKVLTNMGYLCAGSRINMSSLEYFTLCISTYEDAIFSNRSKWSRKCLKRGYTSIISWYEKNHPFRKISKTRKDEVYTDVTSCARIKTNGTDSKIKQLVKIKDLGNINLDKVKYRSQKKWSQPQAVCHKRFHYSLKSRKEDYYLRKQGITPKTLNQMRRLLVAAFIRGICWTMTYYFAGVESWTWFYPYHYAPLASDLIHLKSIRIDFSKTNPFKPFCQLIGVLPERSSKLMPSFYQRIFCNSNSSLINLYPTSYVINMKGKRFAWQGLSLLPFFDEIHLFHELFKYPSNLSGLEKLRNSLRLEVLFIHKALIQRSNHFLKLFKRFEHFPIHNTLTKIKKIIEKKIDFFPLCYTIPNLIVSEFHYLQRN